MSNLPRLASAWLLLVGLLVGEVVGLPEFFNSCTVNFTGGSRLQVPFCNSSLDIEDRLDDLLTRLTYREKAFALDHQGLPIPRLGVPAMRPSESTHGVSCGCGEPGWANGTGCPTSFPSGTGLGASFDRALWSAVGSAIGIEGRALNNQGKSGIYFLDPNINLQRDPRWGRSQEVPGECPTLTSEYAAAIVAAVQRGPEDPRYLVAAVTIKHFSMYDMEGYIPRTDPGSISGGYCDTPGGCERWNFDMTPPVADFVDYYLPPFRAAIERSRPESIMCSYNAAFGLPTCADDHINNGMARGEWGFDGFFVSDCTALELMQDVKWDDCAHPYPSEGGHCDPAPFPGGHNYTTTVGETVRAALVQGGIDLNCGALYKTNLYSELKSGSVSEADIDRAARRVYRTAFRLGMLDPMEDQYYVNKLGPDRVDSPKHRALALEAARKSLVLLKNERKVLPLNKDVKIAFVGPHANSTQSLLSNYHGQNDLVNTQSPLMAARAAGLHVTYEEGCRICDYPYGKNPGFPNIPCDRAGDTSGVDAAAHAAAQADVAVVFLGSDQTTEAENFDRNSLVLAGNGSQAELLRAVVAVQPNVVVVLVNGGPVDLNHTGVASILEAFYPGELGGPAIIDAITGAYNPGGKLPYTMYFDNFTQRDIRQTDMAADGGVTYQYFEGPVAFPFGWGLSYTNFTYEWADPIMGAGTSAPGGNHTVRVTNTGAVAGDAVVLAFVGAARLDDAMCGSRGEPLRVPKKRLTDFARVSLQPGQSANVTVSVSESAVSAVRIATGERMLPCATWTLSVGDVVAPAQRYIRVPADASRVLESNEWARKLAARGRLRP